MSSNARKGTVFARRVGDYLRSMGVDVEPEYEVGVGVNRGRKKTRRFDWGNESLLVECKTYDWTAGGNNPSAKLTTANEAMLYFLGAPKAFRKMLFMSATKKRPVGIPETLAEYYVRTYAHLIPDGVEVHEFDLKMLSSKQLWPDPDAPDGISCEAKVAPRQSDSGKDASARAVFYLKLWKTYYYQGFFNVPRRFDDLVREDDGPVTLTLRGNGRIEGYLNRRANRNGTARVMGRTALRDWFQANYSLGANIPVRFDAPCRLTLG